MSSEEQEPVFEVTEASIWTVKTFPLGLVMSVKGRAGSNGWTDFELTPVEYVVYPEDGIHDVYWTGKPGGSLAVMTDVDYASNWIGFPQGDLKGVRVHADSNKLEAMLPVSKP